MNREEHLNWCKKRALEYLPQDPAQAITSMGSDMGKHDKTRDHVALRLMFELMFTGQLSNPAEARKFIEGFN